MCLTFFGSPIINMTKLIIKKPVVLPTNKCGIKNCFCDGTCKGVSKIQLKKKLTTK